MSVSAEQVTKFFETKGQDDSLNATLREAIPAPAEPTPEPEVPHETTPEVKVEKPAVTPEADKPIPDVKFVPLEALQEERAEKKQLRQKLEQFEAWQKQMEPLIAQIPKQEQAQAPDPQTDPFGYQNWALQQLGQQVQETNLWRQQQIQQAQAQEQANRVLGWASQQAKAFEAIQPEYPNAYKFATEARSKEYQALGITDPATINQLIEQDTARIINHAVQNNLNPAELIYKFAELRGFAGKGKTAQGALDPNAQAKIAAGQAAAPKLDKGGQTADGEMTAKDLANISDPVEFEKQWKKVFGKK